MQNAPSLHPLLSRPGDRRGFTLTEIAIVLGIAGILIAAIWIAASPVNRNSQVNQALDELRTITNNMTTMYTNRLPAACGVGNDITDSAVKTNVIPSPYVFTGLPCDQANQPWHLAGGGLTIGLGGGGLYTVSFWGLPDYACVGLLLQETGCDPTQSGCPTQILRVGTFTSINPNAGPPQNWSNITPAQAQIYCNSNAAYSPGMATSNANSLSFVYKP